MTLKELNPNRVKWTVNNAVPSSVLKDFFSKNQKRLTLMRMKLDTIPKDPIKALNLFVDLPDKAFPFTFDWFSKLYEAQPNHSIDDVIAAFLLHEGKITNIDPPEKLIEYCRAILLNLLSPEPNDKLVNFMKSPILGAPQPSGGAPIKSDVKVLSRLLDIIPAALAHSKDLTHDKVSEISDSELIGLMAIADFNLFNRLKIEFKNRSEEAGFSEEVCQSYLTLLEDRFPRAVNLGISIKGPTTLEFLPDIDPVDYQIFGVVTNIVETSRTIFIKVLSLINDGQHFRLSSEERRILFPEQGSIIWLSRGHKKVLSKGGWGIFTISLDDRWDGKSAKYLVKELISEVFPVAFCEHSLKDISRARYWLSSNEYHVANSRSYVLLGRDALIKPNVNANAAIDFEKPMDAFPDAEIFSVDEDYFTPELSSSGVHVDFSSTESYFKKLIKTEISQKLNLSKELQALLIAEFSSIRNGQNSNKVREIIETLDELLVKEALFTELISELNKSPKVQQAIQEGIEKVVAEKTSQADALRAQIKQLEDRKSSLERLTSKEEGELKKLRQGLAGDIRATFEKAAQDGRKVLAETALFQAIIGNSIENTNPGALSSATQAVNEPPQKFYTLSTHAPVKLSIEDEFRVLRFRPNQINRLFDVLQDVSLLGLTLAFKGNASRIFADAFSNARASVLIVNITVGPGTISMLDLLNDKCLLDQGRFYSVKNFDIAPISLYGNSLVDLCYKKFLSGTSEGGVNSIFTFEDSGLGLAYPSSLDASLAIVDTDFIEFDDDPLDLDAFQEFVSDGGALNESGKGALFNIIRSLRTFEGIEDADRLKRLCGFLQGAYFSRFIKSSE